MKSTQISEACKLKQGTSTYPSEWLKSKRLTTSAIFGKSIDILISYHLSYNPEISPLYIYPREIKMNSTETRTKVFTAALFEIVKNWK